MQGQTLIVVLLDHVVCDSILLHLITQNANDPQNHLNSAGKLPCGNRMLAIGEGQLGSG